MGSYLIFDNLLFEGGHSRGASESHDGALGPRAVGLHRRFLFRFTALVQAVRRSEHAVDPPCVARHLPLPLHGHVSAFPESVGEAWAPITGGSFVLPVRL